jgi:hypothetical protein
MDTDPCPECGLSKAEWTIKVEATRTFQVATRRRKKKRTGWIEVQLVNWTGAPMSGAAYRIALPSGQVKKGELDADGLVRLEQLPEGACEVSFPGNLDEGVERETGERHVFELELDLLYSY